MLAHLSSARNRVAVKQQRGGTHAHLSDAALLDRLAPGRLSQRGVARLAVPSELQPPAHLRVQGEEHALASVVENEGTRRQVADPALAPHGIVMLVEEVEIRLPQPGLGIVRWVPRMQDGNGVIPHSPGS